MSSNDNADANSTQHKGVLLLVLALLSLLHSLPTYHQFNVIFRVNLN